MKLMMTICLFLMFPIFIAGKSDKYLVLDAPGYCPGFFSCFQSVIGCLDEYDKNEYAGLSVEFKKGLYFDPAVGPDWWEYYFEPIRLGSSIGAHIIHISDDQKGLWAFDAISKISRERAAYLIHKYIKIKKPILEEICIFKERHFKGNFVIGVHYRGTDKVIEAPSVSYTRVYTVVDKIIREQASPSYKIFVATDEERFIRYMKARYGDKICCLDAIRAYEKGKPIHFHNGDQPALQGKESIIDCILLSQTDILVRTKSNLSSSAANMNPELPVINLNSTYVLGLRKIRTSSVQHDYSACTNLI